MCNKNCLISDKKAKFGQKAKIFQFFFTFFGNIFPRHFLFLLPQENPCQIKQNALSRNFCPRALLHLLF